MDTKFSDISHKGFGKAERVYLFHGPEDALKRKAVEMFLAAFVDKDTRDFDCEIRDGSGATADRILGGAMTAALGSGRRVVVVNYANDIASDEQERLVKGIEKIPECSTVILIEPRGEPSKSNPKTPKKGSRVIGDLRKAIGKIGTRVEFPASRPEAAKQEAQSIFRTRGKKVSPALLEALVRRVGSDLAVLASEIDKVVSYVGDRETVTIEDMVNVTSPTPEERIWALVEAIGARNSRNALHALEDIFDAEGSAAAAPRVLAMIARQLRLIWQMRLLMDAGIGDPTRKDIPAQLTNLLPSEPNLIGVVSKQRFNTGRYRAQAQGFSIRQLTAAFERLLRADLALKGIAPGPRDPRVVMELVVVELCGGSVRQ